MLPVDVIPLKKEETDLYKIQSVVDKTIRNFVPKRLETTERKSGFSFMIEDILGDSQTKKGPNHTSEVLSTSPCRQCLPTSTSKEPVLNFVSDAHPYALNQEPNRFFPSTSPVFLPPLSPTSVASRYNYYSPAIASSPPFSISSRPVDVFTFLPSEYNDHIQANYFNVRQDSFVRSSLCSPSVILDLSNYIPKSPNHRIPPSSVIPMPSANVECPSSRPIIWKHIGRNTAKRKGGQIRFTSEQTSSLENTFLEHKYLSSTERKRLATALRLSERQVKTWFQNRRAKWRRVKQDPSGGAVSSSDSEECHPVNEPRQSMEAGEQPNLSAFK